MLAGQAWAQTTFTKDNLEYTVTGTNTVSVTGTDGDIEGTLEIPSSVEYESATYNVTGIGEQGLAYSGCKSIIIPNSVTTIGDQAFKWCSQLESVSFSNSVITIGSKPFVSCSKMTAVNVADGNTAFSSEGGILFNKDKTTLIYCPSAKIGAYTIPNSVTTIGDFAFSFCKGLTSITIQNSVTTIGTSAFEYCHGLTSITVPNSVTNIGDDAFNNCVNLASATISNAITSISEEMFLGCGLTSFEIPSGVTSIEEMAFYACGELTSLIIPNTVTTIKTSSIRRCSKLKSIIIPKTVTTIYPFAFSENDLLTIYCEAESKPTDWNGSWNLDDNTVVWGYDPNAKYWNVTVSANNTSYGSVSDGGMVKDGTSITINANPASGYKFVKWSNDLTTATATITVTSDLDLVAEFAEISLKYEVTGSNTVQVVHSEDYKNLTDIVIPETVVIEGKTYTVTCIGGSAFSGCGSLKTIVIPNTVTTISGSAFQNCRSLNSITIPQHLTEIEQLTFANCTNLSSIIIPISVSNMGNNVFYGCSDITIYCEAESKPDGWNNNWYSGDNVVWDYKLFHFEITSNTTVEVVKLNNNIDLTDIVIPETVVIDGKTYTVTSIGNDAFYYRYDMTSITIPNTVTHIGKEAFGYCSGLTSITIPNSVTSMDKAVFKGCSSLESITLPYAFKQPLGYIFGESEYEGAIKTVQEQLLERTPNTISHEWFEFYIPSTLKSVTINGGKLANSAFYNCNGLSTIIIGYSVTTISEEAFYGCGGLTTVVIGNFEGGEDVYGNNSLATVIIGDGVKSVGGYAFRGCNNLKTVIIGDSVTDIGDGAFNNCDRLTSVVIGESVKSIGEDAFYGCGSLKSVVIGKSVDSVGDYAFNGCDSLSSVIIKSDVNLSISELWIKKDGVQYRVENKNTVSVDHDYEYDYSGDIVIPATVTAGTIFDVKSIAPYAFNYDSITSITIPNSVTEIGEAAFSHCRCLTTITIPNSVVSIGGWAFNTCTSLTEINVESGNTEYVSVDGVLFNKDKTILISYPAGKTGEYIIPSSVKEIATHAFSGCNDSTTIIIPKTVRTIDYYAFYDCAATIKCMVNEKPDGWDSGWRDNFKGVVVWAAIIESAANTVNIYAYGSTIVVENATDEIRVYNAMGTLVGRDAAHCVHAEIIVNGEGVYIIKTGSTVKRVVIN